MVHLRVEVSPHIGRNDTVSAVREIVQDENQVEAGHGEGIYVRGLRAAQSHEMRRVLSQLNIAVVEVDAIPAHTEEQEELA